MSITEGLQPANSASARKVIVLVALYRYVNYPVRILHAILARLPGITVHSIFMKNCDTNNFAMPSEAEEALFIEKIRQLDPMLVGFSVLLPHLPVAQRLTRLVRENSRALVVWGGIHPTILPDSCLDEADVVCVGEGEEALVELVNCLSTGQSYRAVRNLWLRDGKEIVRNPMRPLIQDLDALPFPAYGEPGFSFIENGVTVSDDPELLDNAAYFAYTSRGCPFTCSYCVNGILQRLYHGLGSYTRRRSVESIIGEIRAIRQKPGVDKKYVYFVDELFGKEEEWLDAFVTRYPSEVGLPFFVEYSPQIIDVKMIARLAGAGLDTVDLGVQSGSDFIRNTIFTRAGKNRDILELVRGIAQTGVKLRYDLITDNPYENEDTLKETIEFLLQLPRPFYFNLYALKFFPKYDLTEKAIANGIIGAADAETGHLSASITKDWAYVPRLPLTKKRMLENIVWLIVWNSVPAADAQQAVFGESWSAKLLLLKLNVKAVVLGKSFGIGGWYWRGLASRYHLVRTTTVGIGHALHGEWGTFLRKLKNKAGLREGKKTR